MLSLTRKADYAIVALSDLARGSAARSSARAIAERTKVPLPVLTNVLHQLLRHGLVTSAMGAKGGYALARPAEQINLAEMIDAIEGTFKLTICCQESEQTTEACELGMECQIKEPVRRVHDSLRWFLSHVTLEQIAFNNVPVGLTVRGGMLCEPATVTQTVQ